MQKPPAKRQAFERKSSGAEELATRLCEIDDAKKLLDIAWRRAGPKCVLEPSLYFELARLLSTYTKDTAQLFVKLVEVCDNVQFVCALYSALLEQMPVMAVTSQALVLAWLKQHIGECACGASDRRHKHCQTQFPDRQEMWTCICRLCVSLSESVMVCKLLNYTSVDGSDLYISFLERFAAPLLCYQELLRLHFERREFYALSDMLHNFVLRLAEVAAGCSDRDEIWAQGMTKKPTLMSVYLIINLVAQLAIQDVDSGVYDRALCSFLALDAQAYDWDHQLALKYWWDIPRSTLSELDERLYLYDEEDRYMFFVNHLRLPESIAVLLTTKKIKGRTMRQALQQRLTEDIIAKGGENSEVASVVTNQLFGTRKLDALNQLYKKMLTSI